MFKWYLAVFLLNLTPCYFSNLRAQEISSDTTAAVADDLRWRHEVYSENIFLSREEILILNAQHRSDFGGSLWFLPSSVCGLGLHSGYELAFPAGLNAKYHNYSFAYYAPGLLCRGQFYALILESRRKFHFDQDDPVIGNTHRPGWDHRAVLALHHDSELAVHAHWQLYNQAYFESVYTTGDHHNLIAAGHSRFGLQWHLPQSTHYLRLFVEPFAAADRNKWFYNNRWEIRSGAVWVLQLNQNMAIWAMGGPIYVKNYGRNAEQAPLKDRNWGTRALLIVNVTLGGGL